MESIIAPERLVIMPPQSDQEAGFQDCATESQIETRIREITGTKLDDVWSQVSQDDARSLPACVVCADTIVVVRERGALTGRAAVLGKPPAEHWQSTVREWFQRYYASGTHDVWSCVGVQQASSRELFTVRTEVAMGPIDDWWIDWYVSTSEPIGKAGGYGIQGLAAHMIQSVNGSLTNVIGLPMMELVSALQPIGVLKNSDAASADPRGGA